MNGSNPDSEIEFGEVRSARLRSERRPDRDAYYAVLACGQPDPQQLPIFVDLDAIRDIESHAASNTEVELGGVLLGHQAEDEAGEPFVRILDSLRAEHYQATRGSFKFTHETWAEITRRRTQMHPDLQIVGWYHTHPGWGIFLSDMDLFICDHFFSRPLDVALVVDPRQGTRGWFQWNAEGRTEQLAAYYLVAHRHRIRELHQFVQAFAGPPMTPSDPRFPAVHPAGTTTVQVIEREGAAPWLGWSMLGLQTVAVLALAYKMLFSEPIPAQPIRQPQSADVAAEPIAARSEIYRELLESLLARQGTPPDLAKMYADSKLENEQLAGANQSHLVRIDRLESDYQKQNRIAQLLETDKQSLLQRVHQLETETKNLSTRLAMVQDPVSGLPTGDDSARGVSWSWWIAVGLLAVVSGIAGWGIVRVGQLTRRLAETARANSNRQGDEPTVSAHLKSTA